MLIVNAATMTGMTDTETVVATVEVIVTAVVTVVVIVIAWETAMETETVTGIVSVIGMAVVVVTIMLASDTARMNLARMTLVLGEDIRHWTSSKVLRLCPATGGYH